jgi:serine protease Do
MPARRVKMTSGLLALSNDLADAVGLTAPSVVQVQGRGRPASGVVHSEDVVVTMARALGREDGLRVRRHDGVDFDAELAGWDPTTSLAVLRVSGLGVPPVAVSPEPPRVGHIAIAVARSWSNAVTASAGLVSVIGGPLRTGRRRAIDQVIRTSAPMHDGFAGGAFADTSGRLMGLATASAIRGLGVVIPAGIVWRTTAGVLEHGSLKRGYIGVAGQTVQLSGAQRESATGRDRGLLVVAVTADGPAAAAGLLVGDLLLDFDDHAVTSADELLDLLAGARAGQAARLRILRGVAVHDVRIDIGERAPR